MDIDKIADFAYGAGANINRLAISQSNMLRILIENEVLNRRMTGEEEIEFQESFWDGLRDG